MILAYDAPFATSVAMRDFQHFYIAWAGNGVRVAATADGGATWTQSLAFSGAADIPSLAIDANGNLGVAANELSSNSGILFARSTSAGARWTASTVFSNSSRLYTVDANLAFDSGGKALIVYDQDAVRFTREQ
ncbi:MAG TPA: hypothetical protein VF912_09625 [Anaeromyxobacter sp.]